MRHHRRRKGGAGGRGRLHGKARAAAMRRDRRRLLAYAADTGETPMGWAEAQALAREQIETGTAMGRRSDNPRTTLAQAALRIKRSVQQLKQRTQTDPEDTAAQAELRLWRRHHTRLRLLSFAWSQGDADPPETTATTEPN